MYLLPEGEERSTSAVKQLASIMKAENRTFHSEHVFSISIWDGEGTLLNGHQLLGNEQIHRVRCQELWANHSYRVRQGWSAWSSRRRRHRIGHCHTETLHKRGYNSTRVWDKLAEFHFMHCFGIILSLQSLILYDLLVPWYYMFCWNIFLFLYKYWYILIPIN